MIRVNFDTAEILGKILDLESSMEHIFEGRLAKFEHFVHEIMHALSLGVPIRPGSLALHRRISLAIGEHSDGGIAEEANTLAAEHHFFAGIGQPIDDCELEDVAYTQGVSDEDLQSAIDSAQARQLADMARAWLFDRQILFDDGVAHGELFEAHDAHQSRD